MNNAEQHELLLPHLKKVCARQYNEGRIVVPFHRDSLMTDSEIAAHERAVHLKLTLNFSHATTLAPASPIGQTLSARKASPDSREGRTSPFGRLFSPRTGRDRRWSANFSRSQSEGSESSRRSTVAPGRQLIFTRSRRPSEPVLSSHLEDEVEVDNVM